MLTLLEHINVEVLDRRTVDNLTPITFVENQAPVKPCNFMPTYRFSFQIVSEFTSDDSHYPQALKWARSNVKKVVYAEVLEAIHRMQGMVYAGDKVNLLRELESLQEKIIRE